jgi:hypothetical protein
MNTSSSAIPKSSPGRLLLVLGVALPFVGIAGYALQLWAQRLFTPWYLPCLATIGVLLLAVSLWQARSFWRGLALLFVLLLAGFESAFLFMARLPEYTGPIAVGQPFPVFTTQRADGTPFTQRDLPGEQSTVMVFFRGRW